MAVPLRKWPVHMKRLQEFYAARKGMLLEANRLLDVPNAWSRLEEGWVWDSEAKVMVQEAREIFRQIQYLRRMVNSKKRLTDDRLDRDILQKQVNEVAELTSHYRRLVGELTGRVRARLSKGEDGMDLQDRIRLEGDLLQALREFDMTVWQDVYQDAESGNIGSELADMRVVDSLSSWASQEGFVLQRVSVQFINDADHEINIGLTVKDQTQSYQWRLQVTVPSSPQDNV